MYRRNFSNRPRFRRDRSRSVTPPFLRRSDRYVGQSEHGVEIQPVYGPSYGAMRPPINGYGISNQINRRDDFNNTGTPISQPQPSQLFRSPNLGSVIFLVVCIHKTHLIFILAALGL